METAVTWCLTLGAILIGAGLAIWGFVDGSRIAAIWIGFIGAVLIAIAAALTLQKYAAEPGPTAGDVKLQRAYLTFDNFSFTGVAVGERPTFGFVAVNHGKTPAYKARWFGTVIQAKFPLPDSVQNLDTPSPKATAITIAPGASQSDSRQLDKPLSQDDFDNINREDRRLHFLGLMRYEDAFGFSRTTRFCVEIGGKQFSEIMTRATPGGVVNAQGVIRYCDRFNDAD